MTSKRIGGGGVKVFKIVPMPAYTKLQSDRQRLHSLMSDPLIEGLIALRGKEYELQLSETLSDSGKLERYQTELQRFNNLLTEAGSKFRGGGRQEPPPIQNNVLPSQQQQQQEEREGGGRGRKVKMSELLPPSASKLLFNIPQKKKEIAALIIDEMLSNLTVDVVHCPCSIRVIDRSLLAHGRSILDASKTQMSPGCDGEVDGQKDI